MAPPLDPYRTLGLTRTATPAEVKQAYRRLAKANHPDAAGEAALPRFLAIQAAYDQIMGPGAAGNGTGTSAPRRPWSADPDRTDATHRAYGGRARRTRPSGPRRADPRRGPAPGAPGATGSGATGSGASGSGASGEGTPGTGAGGPTDETGAPRGGSRRARNKATLGSTSYDGAEAEPFEPDWGGASWYGTTSGTYWTLNPKEYADPRKHGPEYQARARRAAAEGREVPPDPVIDIAATPIDEAPTVDPPTGGPGADTGAAGVAGTTGTPGTAGSTGAPATPPPTHTTASWWDATAGPAGETTGDAVADPRPAGGDPRPATAASGARPTAGAASTAARADAATSPAGVGSMAAASAAGWAWLDDAHPRPPARIARAIIGWIPIALAIGWLGGELSGCARFAADCDPSSSAATWLFQAAALAVLLLLPALATPAAIAAIAAVVVAVPAALILAAPGTEGPSTEATTALGVLLAVAWVGGLGVGVGRSVRGMSKRLS